MPTQPPQAGSNPVQATDGTPLNPQAVNLAKAIRQQESQGNYNAIGDKGESHGAYQFNKDNFKNWASQYKLDPSDFSPTNQDKVAYHRINDLLTQGKAPSEVAAIWNGAHVENGKYVANVPAYVEGVKKHYAAITGGTEQPPSQTTAAPLATGGAAIPTAQASTGGTQAPKKSFGEQALDVAGKVGDFLFPVAGDISNVIKGKNTKSPLQILGDTALSALPFVPGLGEVGAGAGLLGKVAGSAVTKGLATGYLGDVGQHLSQGDTDIKKVLTPGLGTATGGLLGTGEKLLASGGNSVAGRMVNSLIKPLKKDFSYGKNPGRAVAEEGIVGNSLDELATNIGERRKQIGAAIGQIGEKVSPHVSLSLTPALKPLEDAMEHAASTNNTAVFTRLQAVKKALTHELTAGVDEMGSPTIISKGARKLEGADYNAAQQLKTHIGDMTQWTGNPSDDKTVNAALQNVWRNIGKSQKEGVAKIPGIGQKALAQLEKLNQRYSDLTSAEIATKYREAIHGRQNLISLGDKLAGGAGLIGGFMTGGPIGSAIGSAALTGLNHAAGTTAVKSRVASGLARMGGARSVLKRPAGNAARVVKGLIPSAVKTTAIRTAAKQN